MTTEPSNRSEDQTSETSAQDDRPLQVRGEPPTMPGWVPVLHHSTTALLVAAGFSLAIWTAVNTVGKPSNSSSDRESSHRVTDAVIASNTNARRERIELSLEIYRLIEREYPERLRSLATRGLLASSDLYYASGRPRFHYSTNSGQVRLSRHTTQSDHSSPPETPQRR